MELQQEYKEADNVTDVKVYEVIFDISEILFEI